MWYRTRVLTIAASAIVPLAVEAQSTRQPAHDTAHAAMQRRGEEVMGVDQATSVHVFESLPNGGIIELQRASDDSVGIRAIRAHLRGIAQAFSAGDFGSPAYIHSTTVPGAVAMGDRHTPIRYDYRELPRGAALRITTNDAVARRAVWEFIAFQRNEHMAGERP